MILGVQILGVAFGLSMVYFSFLHYKRRDMDKTAFLIWEIIWIGFILVVIIPQITYKLTRELGIARITDLITIVAFMFLTFLCFYNYISLNKLNRKLEEKIRKEALEGLNDQI